MNTITTSPGDDTRPVLKFNNPDYTSPIAPRVLEAMGSAGFYVRHRRGVRPALWQRNERGRFSPVNAWELQDWITRTFRCFEERRGKFVDAPPKLASWIIKIVHCGSSGLPVINDQTAELL
jgi:hypothetical protein